MATQNLAELLSNLFGPCLNDRKNNVDDESLAVEESGAKSTTNAGQSSCKESNTVVSGKLETDPEKDPEVLNVLNETLYDRLVEIRDHPARVRRRICAIPFDRTIAEDQVLEDACYQCRTEPPSASDLLTRKKKKLLVKLMASRALNFKRSSIFRAVVDGQSWDSDPKTAPRGKNPKTGKLYTDDELIAKYDIKNLTGFEKIKSTYKEQEIPKKQYYLSSRQIADRRLETFRKTALASALLPVGLSPHACIFSDNQEFFLDVCRSVRESCKITLSEEEKNEMRKRVNEAGEFTDLNGIICAADQLDPIIRRKSSKVAYNNLPIIAEEFDDIIPDVSEPGEEFSVKAHLNIERVRNYHESMFPRQGSDFEVWCKSGDFDGTFSNLTYEGCSAYPLPGTSADVKRGGCFTTSRSANNLLSINEFKHETLETVRLLKQAPKAPKKAKKSNMPVVPLE